MEEQLSQLNLNNDSIIETPRQIQKHELDSVIDFLNQNLRHDYEWSIKDEFPTTFTTQNAHNIHTISDTRNILSHAAMKYMLLRTPQAVFKIATIGSVVTSSEHRQQGLSTQLLEQCLEKAKKSKSDIAILWTNLFDFYRKMGFELAGTELSALIDNELDIDLGSSQLRFHEGHNVDPEALHRLYTKHSVYAVRSQEEFRKYLKTPNTRVYTAWSPTGTLQAYAIEGKGADLTGYIHEWSGGVSSLIPLLAHIRKEQQTPITFLCPRHSSAMIKKLSELGINIHEGMLGMINIVNPEQVCQRVNKYAKSIKQDSFSINFANGSYKVRYKDEEIVIDDHREAVRLVFGPLSNSTIESFSSDAQKSIQTIFPMNLWVWGWDSI